ncbi:RteC domain-containing protein [Zunongwangia atlantica 22II14-10F7]
MYKTILEKFSEEVKKKQEGTEDYLKRAIEMIQFCREILIDMKSMVDENDFESVPEEIYFFKQVKPLPMSYMIYYTHVRSCELHKPKAGKQYKIRFLEKEMRKVNKFFAKNTDFTYYMEQGYTYMDHSFFTRRGIEKFPLDPTENQYFDPDFTTSHDLLWAKIQAVYRYIHYLREQLQKLHGKELEFSIDKRHQVLVWTNSKTALVELIYALYNNEAFNYGKSDLNTVTHALEEVFNIRLDNISKTYMEIKARKGSKTKYLDELGINFQLKMEKEDGLS